MVALVQPHWRDRAITASEKITDGWEVAKSYAARIAEPVLFLCMVANIVEMLPGVTVWPWFSAMVLGVQAVSLDVAGFGLNTMADHARRAGNEQAANKAERTGWLLIGIMIATLLAVATGMLFPQVAPILVYVEKTLILVRVALTVWYGHVIHGLRSSHNQTATAPAPAQATPVQPPIDLQPLHDKIAQLEEQLATLLATKPSEIVDNEPTPQPTEEQPVNIGNDDANSDDKTVTLVDREPTKTQARGEGVKRARAILKRHPNITATDLAKRANISRSYASQLIQTHHRPGLRLVNE